jgi:hypothetical protein
MTKSAMTSKFTSAVAHFKSLADALVLCSVHRLMQHVQGYPRSHWTLPLGNYSLRIAQVAARATANKTTMKKWANFAGHFDGRSGALVQYCVHRPLEDVQGFGKSHWTPPSGEYCSR